MKVVYTAPNRAHHYRYALALQKAGMLHAFVSGFPRISPRASEAKLASKLHRADLLQTVYIASLKAGVPAKLSTQLAYLSKIEQDMRCRRHLDGSDVFMFYNGSGLLSCQRARRRGIITVVEAVNSHVDYQEQLLAEEHHRIGLSWTPFHRQEKERRIEEYAQADYILTPSDFVKTSFLSAGFPDEKILKVPFGFDSLPVTVKPRDTDSFTVLYVGSISVRKGIRYLIQAFDKLKHPRKKLVLVGPRTELDGLRGISIPDGVIFTGVLKGHDLAAAYQTADVFCLPTLEEGMALVLGEALSYGLPIVTTTNSGGYDMMTDQQEGFIVPIQNSDAIAEKLQRLADDADLLQAMRLSAQNRATSLAGWSATEALLTDTLTNLTARS